ncbi:hypothetical protein B0I33_101292 [Prauserella shujinwangii]|uniref:Cell division protein FtsL n=1 Tax=Prauserella shujinwangii TaxID=1453103 RepID=A0A2T0M353_9PSEU|nr:septum formation initiator [Prauserella shujinwangii]PRX51139.1 hypothetical protein B0I33_101292 [Prauserella shujinwangii]
MTAPARTRTRTPSSRTRQRPKAPAGTTTVEENPGTGTTRTAPERARPRQRSTAAERAYARRAQRADALRRGAEGTGADAERERRPGLLRLLRGPRSRATFVLIQMALLAAGVATTLWLSTQAITDSYRLEQLRENNARLAEQVEQLQRDVTSAQSPSSLADRAKALGMVPGGNPARLVVSDDGSIQVVGEPETASAPARQAPQPERAPRQGDESPRQEGNTREESGGD